MKVGAADEVVVAVAGDLGVPTGVEAAGAVVGGGTTTVVPLVYTGGDALGTKVGETGDVELVMITLGDVATGELAGLEEGRARSALDFSGSW